MADTLQYKQKWMFPKFDSQAALLLLLWKKQKLKIDLTALHCQWPKSFPDFSEPARVLTQTTAWDLYSFISCFRGANKT